MTYLIVGNGPAGVGAVERIREFDQTGKIILVSPEANPPYSRIMTPEYMTDEVKEEDLYIRGEDFYEKYHVETRLGRRVIKILEGEHKALLDDGEELVYDKALLATGSHPIIPPWVDLKVKGVFTLWDKLDSERINQHLPETKEAVIVGGGLVGLQAARALTAQGVKVTIVEKLPRLMPLQLDETASGMLFDAIEAHGVKVLLDTEVTALEAEEGKIVKVRTTLAEIPADLVLISIGVRPNLQMIEDGSLTKERGLITDYQMQTSHPDVYAAGDVAQAPCQLTGNSTLRALWLCAVQQGKVAGANMAGINDTYQGSKAMNSIQLFGLSFLSVGQTEALEGDEEQIIKAPLSGAYQKLIFKEGRLVGLIFVGEVQKAGILYHKLGEPLYKGYWNGIQALDDEEMFV